MKTQEQKYNEAGEALADWLEECEEAEVSVSITSVLLLDKAIDLSCTVMGVAKTMEAVGVMIKERIKDEVTSQN